MISKIENFIGAATAGIVLLGAIYLKFYWKAFGINAFDFASLVDIGLSTSGELMMLIYTIVISIVGILIEKVFRDHPKFKHWIATLSFLIIGAVGYTVSIRSSFEKGWVAESISALSLLLLTVFFCQSVTWFLDNHLKKNDQANQTESPFRAKAHLWIALIILIGMSYLEAVDDSRDILELKKYAYVSKNDNPDLPAPKMIFLGKIGDHYFFREPKYKSCKNGQKELKAYIYPIDDDTFKNGMILYQCRK